MQFPFRPAERELRRTADAGHGALQRLRQVGAKERQPDRRRPGIENEQHHWAAATIMPSAAEASRAGAAWLREVSRIGTLAPITSPPAQQPMPSTISLKMALPVVMFGVTMISASPATGLS